MGMKLNKVVDDFGIQRNLSIRGRIKVTLLGQKAFLGHRSQKPVPLEEKNLRLKCKTVAVTYEREILKEVRFVCHGETL